MINRHRPRERVTVARDAGRRTSWVGERVAVARDAGRRTSWVGERGQATVEAVAVLPLALVTALSAATILAQQGAQEHAGEAAHAGAMALLQDADPSAAAREALPRAEQSHAAIRVAGRRVTVTLRSPSPLRDLLPHLSATAVADAGPVPVP